MASLTTQHPELLETQLKEIFFKKYSQLSLLYPQVFNIRSSTLAHEDALRVRGLGTFALKPEGTPVAYSDPITGARVRVTHASYARGFRVTKEMRDDDQWEVMEQMPADLGDSARDHQEVLAWGQFNNGFTGAAGFTGLDGLSLFNTAHTRLDGSATDSNQLSPGIALSVTGLEAAEQNFMNTQSEEGRQITIRPAVLLVPVALHHQARRLLQSEFDPESADNAINTVGTSMNGVAPLTVQYLTSATNWFLGAPKDMHSVIWWDRELLGFDRGTDFSTKDSLFDGFYRASNRHRDWRGWVGSAP